MSFKFQGNVVYEQLGLFTKDIYMFTGKLPDYESTGLIPQIRSLAASLLTEYAKGNIRTDDSDPQEALDSCLIIIAKIAALVDLTLQLKYVDVPTHTKVIFACEEITKRLYDTRKNLHH